MKSIRNHFVIGIFVLNSLFWHMQTDELNPLLLYFLRLLALEIRIPRTETMSDAVSYLKVSLKKNKNKQKNQQRYAEAADLCINDQREVNT